MSKHEGEHYGVMKRGEKIQKFTLKNGKSTVEVIEYGARITKWFYENLDLVTGYDTLDEYTNDRFYKGGICGRTTGRIKNAQFELNGKLNRLSVNYPPHQLHGGTNDFTKKVWRGEQLSSSVVKVDLVSPAGDEGYPGELRISVYYEITADDALIVGYHATAVDEATPINPTNHAFFNLGGHDHGTLEDHSIRINADHHLNLDERYVPLDGKIHGVDGTKFDLRQSQMLTTNGLAAHYITGAEGSRYTELAKEAARFTCKSSNLRMRMYTTAPGLEFYDAIFFPEEGIRGKNGVTYPRRSCFCCVAHGYPDTMHQPDYPSMVYNQGEVYTQITAHLVSNMDESSECEEPKFLQTSEIVKIIGAGN